MTFFKQKNSYKIYDTHAHLNDERLFPKSNYYIKRAKEFGVKKINVIGYNSKGNKMAIKIAQKFPKEVKAIIGFQPEDSKHYNEDIENNLKIQLKDPSVVGIGEIGLDWHWPGYNVQEQIKAFKSQLKLSKELNFPVMIHMRDSFKDIYEILKRYNINRFQLHSFSGNAKQALKLVDLGGYISFSGLVTFKHTKEINQAAKAVPLQRLLVETDSPFLAPVPKRGRINEPAFTKFVINHLANLLKIDNTELAKITTHNSERLWKEKK